MKKNKLLIIIAIIFFIICISNFSKAASNDTALKSISIEPSGYELVQDESDNKIYRVKVDNSVTSIKVNAVPNNKDATISVNGNNELAVGTNKVTISVTAKNGDKSIYTIYVRRASTPIAQEQVIPNLQDDYIEKQNVEASNNDTEIKTEENNENNENINEQVNKDKDTNIEKNNTEIYHTSDDINKANTPQNIITNISKKKMIIFIAFFIFLIIIVGFIIKKSPKVRHL